MNTPAKAVVNATPIDLTSGEAAAVSLSRVTLTIAKDVQKKLEARHGGEQAALFHTVFLARYIGFVAGHFGPEGALGLLDATRLALTTEFPNLEREMAARHRRKH